MIEQQFYTCVIVNVIIGLMMIFAMWKMASYKSAENETPKRHRVLKVFSGLSIVYSVLCAVLFVYLAVNMHFPTEMIEPPLTPANLANSDSTLIFGFRTFEQWQALNYVFGIFDSLAFAVYFYFFKSSGSKWYAKMGKILLVVVMIAGAVNITSQQYLNMIAFSTVLFIVPWLYVVCRKGNSLDENIVSVNSDNEESEMIDNKASITKTLSCSESVKGNTVLPIAKVEPVVKSDSQNENVANSTSNPLPKKDKKTSLAVLFSYFVPIFLLMLLLILSIVRYYDVKEREEHYTETEYGIGMSFGDMQTVPDSMKYFRNREYRWIIDEDYKYYSNILEQNSIARVTLKSCYTNSNNDLESDAFATFTIFDIRDKVNGFTDKDYEDYLVRLNQTDSNRIPLHINCEPIKGKPTSTYSSIGEDEFGEFYLVFHKHWAYILKINANIIADKDGNDYTWEHIRSIKAMFLSHMSFSEYEETKEYITSAQYKFLYIIICIIIGLSMPLYFIINKQITHAKIANKQATCLCWWVIVMYIGWVIFGALIVPDEFSRSKDLLTSNLMEISEYSKYRNLEVSRFSGYSVEQFWSACWLFIPCAFTCIIYTLLLNILASKQYKEYTYDYLLPSWFHKHFMRSTNSGSIKRFTLLFVVWPFYYVGTITLLGCFVLAFYLSFVIAIYGLTSLFLWVKNGNAIASGDDLKI